MNLITRDELREKLDRGDEFTLVMTLPELAYRAKHIPASLHFETVRETLDPAEEIVVYCADVHCVASIYAYYSLERTGYRHVRRYAGGIADWEAAGYPIEDGWPTPAADGSPTQHFRPRTAERKMPPHRRSKPCSCSS